MLKNMFVWLFVISSIYSASAYSNCRDGTTGLPGYCTTKDNCISNREAFYVYGIRTSDCHNIKETCCVHPASGIPKRTENKQKRISALTCNKMNPSELSYLAAIGWEIRPGVYDFRCSGALISPNFVLTSASCVQTKPDSVKLGYFWNESNEMIVVYVEEYIPHEHFDRASLSNDIALLRLSTTPRNIELRFACLWQTDAVYAERLISSNVEPGLKPQIRSVNFKSSTCNNYYRRERSPYQYYSYEKESKICLTSFGDWNPACLRRGSPVIATIKNIPYIVAVTSMMECLPERQTEHTRVSYYLDWIERRVWRTNYLIPQYFNQYRKRNNVVQYRFM